MTCTTSPSDWTGSPGEFRDRFYAGGTLVSAPTPTVDTYTVTDADVGKAVSCQVSASNNGGPSSFIASSDSVAITAPLTVSAPSPTITYGQPVPDLVPGYAGFVNTQTPATLTTPGSCTVTPPAPSEVGTYPITCATAASPDYAISYVAGTLTIEPAPLVVTAPSGSVLDGQTATLAPHYSGLVGGDTPASLAAAATCTTTYHATAFPLPAPGAYPVTCSGAMDPNYAITYVPGTLTVTLTASPGAVDLVGPDGGVFSLGGAPYHGSLPGLGVHLHDIVAIAATPDDAGYLLVGADGGVFAFGDATFHGSLPGLGVHVADIVGIAVTPTSQGYYLVGADGGVFAFGDAGFHGSLPSTGVAASDVVGLALDPAGGGYWIARASGPVAPFGDAAALGSAPSGGIVAIEPTQAGAGYWLTSATGGVFALGDAPFEGSLPGLGGERRRHRGHRAEPQRGRLPPRRQRRRDVRLPQRRLPRLAGGLWPAHRRGGTGRLDQTVAPGRALPLLRREADDAHDPWP